jgi:hypothetical protein
MQVGPRAPLALSESGIAQRDARRVEGLTPAETLLEPTILEAIRTAVTDGPRQTEAVNIIEGTDDSAGVIVLSSDGSPAATGAMQVLRRLIDSKALPKPARTIRFVGMEAAATPPNTKAAILLRGVSREFLILRNLWSVASISDEVVEVFARQFGGTYGWVEQSKSMTRWESAGVPMTGFFYPREREGSAVIIASASAYFLATLPNAGSEALLSHLTVGAHARLAEDGRKAVAQMGNQQRASADVLIMFAQAIEREQRRMRSFERFMPTPVDPMLRSRILDMEKGITSVWTSIGITSSPFVPAAERIRGRGGEDRRIVTRVGAGPLPTPEPPTALLKFPNVDVVIYELGNFIDGKRSISDIRDAVSAEFGPVALPVVVDYFERLAKTGAISIR